MSQRFVLRIINDSNPLMVMGKLPSYMTAALQSNPDVMPPYLPQSSQTSEEQTVDTDSIFETPCLFTFDSDAEDAFPLFTIIDNNGDRSTWRHWFEWLMYMAGFSGDADDWAITPAIQLNDQLIYGIDYISWCQTRNNPEQMEICLGNEPTVEAMTQQVMPTSQITNLLAESNLLRHQCFGSVEQSGAYHLGFHVTTPSSIGFCLWLDSIHIEAICPKTAPDSVTQLQAVAADRGGLSCTLSFTAPATDAGHSSIDALQSVNIYLGDERIATVEAPHPGQDYCLEVPAHQGNNTYTFRAQNANGEGIPSKISLYCGVDVPMSVVNAQMTITETGASVTWQAPSEVGVTGGFVDLSALTYTIFRITGSEQVMLAEGLEQCTYIDADVDLDPMEQDLLYYAVFARNAAGISQGVVTNSAILGSPYDLPFEESFDDGKISYDVMCIASLANGGAWNIIPEFDQDGTNGYALMLGAEGAEARLYTGKVDISQANAPSLSFYYRMPLDGDTLFIDLSLDAENFFTIDTITEQQSSWTKVSIMLDNYKETEYACIGFHGKYTDRNSILCLDHIVVKDYFDYDMAIADFMIPTQVERGEEFEAIVMLNNEGSQAVVGTDYTISFYQNGTQIAECQGIDIEASQMLSVCLMIATDKDTPTECTLSARINYDRDQFGANNRSDAHVFSVITPELPIVTEIVGALYEGQVELAWEQPTLERPITTVTDGFEDYKAFIIDHIGHWTLYDIDGGAYTYSATNREGEPFSYDNVGKPMAYQVFNPAEIDMTESRWMPYNGKQCLMAWADYDGRNDDWVITPLLSEQRQTIAFFAKALSSNYNETFEVYTSSSNRMISNFEKIDKQEVDASRWRRFTYTVPEGTRYLAVRCISKDCLALMLDHFTYDAAAYQFKGELIGYNVYADEVLLNDQPITETTYTTPTSGKEQTAYTVRAVYDFGLSEASEAVIIADTGIELIGAETATEQQMTYDLFGRRIVGSRQINGLNIKCHIIRYNK